MRKKNYSELLKPKRIVNNLCYGSFCRNVGHGVAERSLNKKSFALLVFFAIICGLPAAYPDNFHKIIFLSVERTGDLLSISLFTDPPTQQYAVKRSSVNYNF